eukprot:842973_1
MSDLSKHRTPGLISLIVSSLVLLPQLFLQYKIIQKNAKRCHVPSIKACHCAIFCSTCFIISGNFVSRYCLTDDTASFDVSYCLIHYSSGFLLLFSKISMFLFYIFRLRDIFSETVLAYTSDKLTSVMVLLITLYIVATGAPMYMMISLAYHICLQIWHHSTHST